jgi:hypothetical protein
MAVFHFLARILTRETFVALCPSHAESDMHHLPHGRRFEVREPVLDGRRRAGASGSSRALRQAAEINAIFV